MLLDEPLSALDAKLRQELRIELKEILTSVGTTSIVVTHDQEEAMSMAEYVIVQNRGRIMQRGNALRDLLQTKQRIRRRVRRAIQCLQRPPGCRGRGRLARV